MHYVIPYGSIKTTCLDLTSNLDKNANDSRGSGSNDLMTSVIKLFLRSVEVDERWYKERYPDVAAAIDAGLYRSAKHHFIDSGYFEGRLPGEVAVSEDWYLNSYPDVAEGVKDRLFNSGAEHFRLYGYEEGRLPFPL